MFIAAAGKKRHITAGSDGNLWFTEYDANRIGRITTAGVITEFFITSANTNPIGITAGPDGSLWFTEFSASKIGRIAPPGATPGASFYTLTPCRIIDTRNPNGPRAGPSLVAGTDRLFLLAGACGIPSTARAVAVNAVVTQGNALGHLSVYPGGSVERERAVSLVELLGLALWFRVDRRDGRFPRGGRARGEPEPAHERNPARDEGAPEPRRHDVASSHLDTE